MRSVVSLCGSFHLLVLFLSTAISTSLAGDTIDRDSSVTDGETLVSAGGTLELCFLSLDDSSKKYVVIRFKNIGVDNVVWVANTQSPLNDSTGVLKFGGDGNLVIQDKTGGTVWSSNSSAAAGVTNPVAQLLDSGNLVIRDGDGNNWSGDPYLWQSFDQPGDTLVADMRLTVNRKTGFSRHLTSWRSADDPSPGNYTFRLEAEKLPQLVLLQGSTVKYKSGVWNGVSFSGIPANKGNERFNFSIVGSDGEVEYYAFQPLSKLYTYTTIKLSNDGDTNLLLWNYRASKWISHLFRDDCDRYNSCGPYGVCNFSYCQCLKGFKPRSQQDWEQGFSSGGCVRVEELDCGGGNGFLPLKQVKLPDTRNATVDMSVGVEECRERCSRDCSCTAYARADVREGMSGCITWTGELVDLRTLGSTETDLFLRVPASLLDDSRKNKSKRHVVVVLATSVAFGVLLVSLCGCGLWMKSKKTMMKAMTTTDGGDEMDNQELLLLEMGPDGPKKYQDFSLLNFADVVAATGNLSDENKLGQGGFGPVYKGTFPDGQEIAVKRLSRRSTQGLEEFKTEILLISRLQHRNLVRLLGCCIKGEERMLIYEYMPNKSLDFFLFDPGRAAQLDWGKRFHIIEGIAQGLLYLHKHSRLRIIHRDLKASNILLDSELNPKISDFGMARIFSTNNSEANTNRVVGTYGYMSPEYAMKGLFSVKSDVFSFGVLLLEIVTSKRNTASFHFTGSLNLLGHAWELWNEGRELELVDPSLGDSCPVGQVSRCIHVALMCVQGAAADRPITSDIVSMLGSENASLPAPKQPAFFIGRQMADEGIPASCSINLVTVSATDAR